MLTIRALGCEAQARCSVCDHCQAESTQALTDGVASPGAVQALLGRRTNAEPAERTLDTAGCSQEYLQYNCNHKNHVSCGAQRYYIYKRQRDILVKRVAQSEMHLAFICCCVVVPMTWPCVASAPTRHSLWQSCRRRHWTLAHCQSVLHGFLWDSKSITWTMI